MLKFIAESTDGRTSLWIGLTQDNLDRLPTDPIMFDMAELGSPQPDRVVLVAGPTNTILADRLRAMGLPIPELPEPGPGERFERHGG